MPRQIKNNKDIPPALQLGDLVRTHPEAIGTNPLEGNQYDIVGVGLVVEIKEKDEAPVTFMKEYTVLWSGTGARTLNCSTSLKKITGEEIWDK